MSLPEEGLILIERIAFQAAESTPDLPGPGLVVGFFSRPMVTFQLAGNEVPDRRWGSLSKGLDPMEIRLFLGHCVGGTKRQDKA